MLIRLRLEIQSFLSPLADRALPLSFDNSDENPLRTLFDQKIVEQRANLINATRSETLRGHFRSLARNDERRVKGLKSAAESSFALRLSSSAFDFQPALFRQARRNYQRSPSSFARSRSRTRKIAKRSIARKIYEARC